MKKRLSGALLFAAAFQMMVGLADAASCGNTGEGFEAWKSTFADEAQTDGTSQKAISALIGTSYSSGTIAADRSQKSFTLSLDAFMAKRGAAAIAAKGKSLKTTNAALFSSIENAFGVGQTQFLPRSILLYGVDGDGDGSINLNTKADALASTANFLKDHGWIRGEGHQPGEPNFSAIQSWNAAGVYQSAIAIIGRSMSKDRRRSDIEALSRFRPIRFSSTLCKSWDRAEHKQPKPTPAVGASSPPVVPRIGICDHNAASPSRGFGGAAPLTGFLYSGFGDCWWLGDRLRCDLDGGWATYG